MLFDSIRISKFFIGVPPTNHCVKLIHAWPCFGLLNEQEAIELKKEDLEILDKIYQLELLSGKGSKELERINIQFTNKKITSK